MRYLLHIRYLLRHKLYVLRAGRRRGVALWQLIIHDWSKFLPSEFFPYTRKFFGSDRSEAAEAAFRKAFTLHVGRNPHHWEHWCLEGVPLPIPDRYLQEMLSDWDGAALAKSDGVDTPTFYARNRDAIRLHPLTRIIVDHKMGIANATLATQLHECDACGTLFYENIALLAEGGELTAEQAPAVLAYLQAAHQDHVY